MEKTTVAIQSVPVGNKNKVTKYQGGHEEGESQKSEYNCEMSCFWYASLSRREVC